MRRPFLTARWLNLGIVTYAAPPGLLEPHLPPGLELDRRDGRAFVSLVGFDFFDTRVLGVPWPGYRNFPELNLRFYVRCGPERGVVFIREYVRSRLISWVARTIYHEKYGRASLASSVVDEPAGRTLDFRLDRAGKSHVIRLTGSRPAVIPGPDSVEHFFMEQRWGFGVDRRGRTIRYEVEHPPWEVYPVQRCEVELEWGELYGPEWKIMQAQPTYSAIFAAGSAVKVYPKAFVEREA